MTDYKTLIQLNIEIEGLLHVLSTRDSSSTRELLGAKYAQYKQLIEELLSEDAPAPKAEEDATEIAKTLTADEVKDDEAVESEEVDETDLAAAAIERGEQKDEVKTAEAQTEDAVRVDQALSRLGARDLRRAFTLNDKFRFRRYLFGNDDALFARTLDKISEMQSFAEANAYLTENMQWDFESEEVKDFMSIVENHFA